MKADRHTKILELIEEYDVDTQEELAERLLQAGYQVTQATVSRDIRELKLTKVAIDGGGQRYTALRGPDREMIEKYVRVLRDSFVSMDNAQNIVVLRTCSGMAMAAAAALEALTIDGVVGCIAGDDTIFCAIRTEADVAEVMAKIAKIVKLR